MALHLPRDADGAEDLDRLIGALSRRRRRRILRHLRGRDRLRIDDLAAVLADRAPTNGGEPSDDALAAVRLDLHHRDLPAMARADLLEYDADGGTVTLSERGEWAADRLDDVFAAVGDRSAAE